MVNRCDLAIKFGNQVLRSTGPGILSDVYFYCLDKYNNVKLVRDKYKRYNTGCAFLCCHFGDYAAHLHVNSWTWSEKADATFPTVKESRKFSKLQKKTASHRTGVRHHYNYIWS